jgi:RNA polymerase sigma-70 factor, ECF subfamily
MSPVNYLVSNEIKQIVSWLTLTVLLQFFTKQGDLFIVGLQGSVKFCRISPGSRGGQWTERMSDLSRRVEQEIPRLRRYARALTHATDRADDLVQDTLVRALSRLHLWQPGTDLRAWLFTIMHHQYVNTVRREARERTNVDIEHVSSTLTATTDPTARRQLMELDRALARLPSEQREVVLLVGLEGMSYESVAQILGVPIGTVRSRLSRGRERLRELMGREREPQPANSAASGEILQTPANSNEFEQDAA